MTEELPHIRCIECGKILAHKWVPYQEYLSAGMKPEEAMTKLGLERYCCRMWMVSPFKVPMRSDRQIDPRDTGLEQQATTLTTKTGPQPVIAPLQATTNPQTINAYTVVPLDKGTEVGDIELPAIPEVDLPAIPTLETNRTEKTVKRVYQAW